MPINKAGRAFYSLWKLSKNTTQPNIYYMRYLFNIVLIQVWFANGNAWVVLLEILESYLKKKIENLLFFTSLYEDEQYHKIFSSSELDSKYCSFNGQL